MESDLADKDAVQEVYNKRNQQYTEEDQARLEALMYDKFLVRLQAAQVHRGGFLVLFDSNNISVRYRRRFGVLQAGTHRPG